MAKQLKEEEAALHWKKSRQQLPAAHLLVVAAAASLSLPISQAWSSFQAGSTRPRPHWPKSSFVGGHNPALVANNGGRRSDEVWRMSLTETSMFLSANAAAASIPNVRPNSPASVQVISPDCWRDLRPQDLTYSKRFRDRGILGFTVGGPDDHSISTTDSSPTQHGNDELSSSALNASSRRSSSETTPPASAPAWGENAEGEAALPWTSVSSWSSRKESNQRNFNVWSNSHNDAFHHDPGVASLMDNGGGEDDGAVVLPWIPTLAQIEELTVVQLKDALRGRGLSLSGNKSELRERLSDWTAGQKEKLPRERQFASSPALTNLFKAYGVTPRRGRNSSGGSPTQRKREDDKKDRSHSDDMPLFYDDELFAGGFDGEKSEDGTLTADSLAEWTRTVDLEPLFQRRQAIHKEMKEGKPVQSTRHRARPNRGGKSNKAAASSSSVMSKEEYITVLKKIFDESSTTSRYSNYEVKQIYAAAKEADQMGDRVLSKRILVQLKEEATPNDARIYRRLARMEREDGNEAGARALLHEGLRRIEDPNSQAWLWHGLGTMATSDSEAKRCYRKAIESDPSLPMPYHALGTLEHVQGRIAGAMKTLKQGLRYCPTNHRLHHALGDLYRDAKLLDRAEKCYKKALQMGPTVSHGFAYNALAYVAYENGNVDQCRLWLKRAIALNEGRHANSWVALAQMEEAEGNIDAARTVCRVGIAQYERGLLQRASSSRKKAARGKHPKDDARKKTTHSEPAGAASEIRDRLLATQVPVYRSGDRFFNVYRNWARLEERFGTPESVEEVYRRAVVAFPRQHKLTLDWAEYYAQLNLYERATQLLDIACRQQQGLGEPHRLFAEYCMSRGKYPQAQTVLFRGALALSQKGGSQNPSGMAELYYVWAICEWHLDNLSRAEALLDNALRLTRTAGQEDDDSDGSTRSLILFAMAKLQHIREEPLLAQHCIGLLLKENQIPAAKRGDVWRLWAHVAASLGNERLSAHCEEYAAKTDASTSGTSSSSSLQGQHNGQQLLRRDPWYPKIFGVSASKQRATSFHSIRLPLSPEEEEAAAHLEAAQQ